MSIRSIFDGRYKFSRYFSFKNFNTPQTFELLLANNDLELYDTKTDPNETINLATDPVKYRTLIEDMNLKMNRVIQREIGVDDGKFLPLTDWIDWSQARPSMINI